MQREQEAFANLACTAEKKRNSLILHLTIHTGCADIPYKTRLN